MNKDRAPEGFTMTRALDESAFSSVFEVERAGAGGATKNGGVRGVCKRLTSRGAADAGARLALVREGAIGERLFRAGAPVAEVLASGEDGVGPFLVTRFVTGATLATTPATDLASEGEIAQAERAFAALAAVHDAGVLHRDVHLNNLIVTATLSPPIVILDFGLATLMTDALGADAAFRGTALYASPEAARGETVDASADRFSLAAALLHRATGVPPRMSTTLSALLFEAGTMPLEDWIAGAERTPAAALADRLAPLLRFDRAERAARFSST